MIYWIRVWWRWWRRQRDCDARTYRIRLRRWQASGWSVGRDGKIHLKGSPELPVPDSAAYGDWL